MQLWKYASGRKFFKLRVTHHVGALDLSNILCYKHREDDVDGVDALPDYSRTAIWKIAREQLAENADAPNWWTDDIEQEWVDEVRQWVENLIRRRFPELY
jgi:hypothetical protein